MSGLLSLSKSFSSLTLPAPRLSAGSAAKDQRALVSQHRAGKLPPFCFSPQGEILIPPGGNSSRIAPTIVAPLRRGDTPTASNYLRQSNILLAPPLEVNSRGHHPDPQCRGRPSARPVCLSNLKSQISDSPPPGSGDESPFIHRRALPAQISNFKSAIEPLPPSFEFRFSLFAFRLLLPCSGTLEA